jgi:hypothetical protein
MLRLAGEGRGGGISGNAAVSSERHDRFAGELIGPYEQTPPTQRHVPTNTRYSTITRGRGPSAKGGGPRCL